MRVSFFYFILTFLVNCTMASAGTGPFIKAVTAFEEGDYNAAAKHFTAIAHRSPIIFSYLENIYDNRLASLRDDGVKKQLQKIVEKRESIGFPKCFEVAPFVAASMSFQEAAKKIKEFSSGNLFKKREMLKLVRDFYSKYCSEEYHSRLGSDQFSPVFLLYAHHLYYKRLSPLIKDTFSGGNNFTFQEVRSLHEELGFGKEEAICEDSDVNFEIEADFTPLQNLPVSGFNQLNFEAITGSKDAQEYLSLIMEFDNKKDKTWLYFMRDKYSAASYHFARILRQENDDFGCFSREEKSTFVKHYLELSRKYAQSKLIMLSKENDLSNLNKAYNCIVNTVGLQELLVKNGVSKKNIKKVKRSVVAIINSGSKYTKFAPVEEAMEGIYKLRGPKALPLLKQISKAYTDNKVDSPETLASLLKKSAAQRQVQNLLTIPTLVPEILMVDFSMQYDHETRQTAESLLVECMEDYEKSNATVPDYDLILLHIRSGFHVCGNPKLKPLVDVAKSEALVRSLERKFADFTKDQQNSFLKIKKFLNSPGKERGSFEMAVSSVESLAHFYDKNSNYKHDGMLGKFYVTFSSNSNSNQGGKYVKQAKKHFKKALEKLKKLGEAETKLSDPMEKESLQYFSSLMEWNLGDVFRTLWLEHSDQQHYDNAVLSYRKAMEHRKNESSVPSRKLLWIKMEKAVFGNKEMPLKEKEKFVNEVHSYLAEQHDRRASDLYEDELLLSMGASFIELTYAEESAQTQVLQRVLPMLQGLREKKSAEAFLGTAAIVANYGKLAEEHSLLDMHGELKNTQECVKALLEEARRLGSEVAAEELECLNKTQKFSPNFLKKLIKTSRKPSIQKPCIRKVNLTCTTEDTLIAQFLRVKGVEKVQGSGSRLTFDYVDRDGKKKKTWKYHLGHGGKKDSQSRLESLRQYIQEAIELSKEQGNKYTIIKKNSSGRAYTQ